MTDDDDINNLHAISKSTPKITDKLRRIAPRPSASESPLMENSFMATGPQQQPPPYMSSPYQESSFASSM